MRMAPAEAPPGAGKLAARETDILTTANVSRSNTEAISGAYRSGVLPDDCVHQFLLVLFRLVAPHGVNAADQVSHVGDSGEWTLSLGGVWLRGLAGRGCGGTGQQADDHLGEPAVHRGVGEKPTRGELARNPGTARPLSQMPAPAILRILRRSACAHAAP
jgi:hypothetical protein